MRVAAFTILEMVITLLLMSIVISMVYVIFDYMSRNTRDYVLITQEDFELRQFQSLLQYDIYTSEKIISTELQSFQVLFYNGSVSKYKSSNGYLYRTNNNQVDSIPLQGLALGLVSQEDGLEEGVVSNISITSRLFGKEAPIYVFKNYYSKIWK